MTIFQRTSVLVAVVGALASAAAAQTLPDPAGETKAYIPVGDLGKVVDPNDKSVLMDRKEFAKLLASAKENLSDAGQPIAQIVQAEYTCSGQPRLCRIQGKLTIRSLTDEPVAVTVPFVSVGLLEVKLDDKPAPMNYDSRGRLQLVVTGAGKHTLSVLALARMQKIKSGLQMSIGIPPAVAGKFAISVDGDQQVLANVPINFSRYNQKFDKTGVELAIGGRYGLSIVLTGNGQQDADRAILLGDITSSIRLDEGVAWLDGFVSVQALRRNVRELALVIDPDWTVLTVSGEDLVSWDVLTPDGLGPKRIVIKTNSPIRGNKMLRVEATAKITGETFTAPRLRLAGADYQRGYLIVDSAGAFTVRSEQVTQARRQDRSELQGMAKLVGAGQRMYFHWSDDWSVKLDLSPIQMKRHVEMTQRIRVYPEKLRLWAGFQCTPVGDEMFGMTIPLPPASAGWDISEIRSNVEPIFQYRVKEDGDKRQLAIRLSKPIPAESVLNVQFVLEKQLAASLNEQDSQVSLPVPILSAQADKFEGLLGLWAVEDFDASVAQTPAGAEPIGVGRLSSLGFGPNVRSAYKFDASVAKEITVQVSRRQSRLTADTVGLIRIEPTGLTGRFDTRMLIDRASTRTLYLLVDKTLGQKVKFTVSGTTASQRIVEPGQQTVALSQADAAAWNLWQLDLERRVRGQVMVTATYQVPLTGEATRLPLVHPAGGERASLVVAVDASEELAVALDATSARALDLLEVPPLPGPAPRLLGAWRIDPTAAEPPSILAKTTIYNRYEVPSALISRMQLSTQLDPTGRQNTVAEVTLLNAGLQSLVVRLPKSAQLWSATVGASVVKPAVEPNGDLLLPVPQSTDGVNVRILFAVPGSGSLSQLQMQGPEFPGLEINAVNWAVYPPAGYVVTGEKTELTGPAPFRYPTAPDLARAKLRKLSLGRSRAFSGRAAYEEAPMSQMDQDEKDTIAGFEGRPGRGGELQPPADLPQTERESGGYIARGRYTLAVEMASPVDPSTALQYTGVGQPQLTLTLKSDSSFDAWVWVGIVAAVLAAVALRLTAVPTRWLALAGLAGGSWIASVLSASLAPLAGGLFIGALAAAALYGVLALAALIRRNVAQARAAAVAAALLIGLFLQASPARAELPGPRRAQGSQASPWIVPYTGDPAQARQSDKILVPYWRYVRIWNLAHPDNRIEVVDRHTQLQISEAKYETKIDKTRVDLTCTARIVNRTNQWTQMPMDFGPLAVLSAQLGDQQAMIQRKPGQPATLLIAPKTDAKLQVRCVGAMPDTGLRGRFALSLPPLPGSVMTVKLFQDDLELEVDGISSPVVRPGGLWTVPTGPHRQIALRWRPQAQSGDVDNSISANVNHSVYAYPWSFVGRTELKFRWFSGHLDRFWALLPKGVQITWVGGEDLRDYRVIEEKTIDGETYDMVEFRLYRKVTGPYSLDLRWISPIGEMDSAQSLKLPQPFSMVYSGNVDLYAAGGMDMKVTEVTGGRQGQISSSQAKPIAGADLVGRYYWPFGPYKLKLELGSLQVRRQLQMDQLVRISRDEVQLLTQATVSAKKGKLFSSSFVLPNGYDLLSVRGQFVSDWFVQEGQNSRVVHVSFLSGVRSASMAIVCVRRDGQLQKLAVPMLSGLDKDGKSLEATGRLAVQVAEALEASTVISQGLKSIPPVDVRGWLQGDQLRAVQYAFRYDRTQPALALHVEPRPTRIRTEVKTGLSVRPESAMYTYLIRYNVSGSPIDKIRFSLPTRYASLVDVQSRAMRSVEVRKLDGNGQSQWTVYLLNEVTGVLDVAVNFSIPITQDTAELPLPVLQTEMAADGYRAVVAIQNLSRHEVSLLGVDGLTPIPVSQQRGMLSAGVQQQLQYMLQSFDDSYRGKLAVKPAEQTEQIDAVIDLMEVRSLIDQAGKCRYEVVLSLQNRSKQFLALSMPEGLSLWSAVVDSQPVRPVVGSDGDRSVRIPLVKASAAALPYEVKLYFGGQLPGGIESLKRIAPPAVRVTNIPVKRTAWSLLLPEGYQYIRPEGNMSSVAGTAELMSLNVDAKLDQLERVVTSSDEYIGSGNQALSNFEEGNKKLSEQIGYNEKYLRDNRDQIDGKDLDRLKGKIARQRQVQEKLVQTFQQKRAQAIQNYDINGYLNSSNTNWGLVEGKRNSTLNTLPGFVSQADQQMFANLRKQVASNEMQMQTYQAQKDQAGRAPGVWKQNEIALTAGEELTELLAPAQTKLPMGLSTKLRLADEGFRYDLDGDSNLAKENAQLQRQIQTLSESRMNRYYQPEKKGGRGIAEQEPKNKPGWRGQQGQQAGKSFEDGGDVATTGTTMTSRFRPRGPSGPGHETSRDVDNAEDEARFSDRWSEGSYTYSGDTPVATKPDNMVEGLFSQAKATGTFSLPMALPETGFVRLDFTYPGAAPEVSVLAVGEQTVTSSIDAGVWLGVVVVTALGVWLITRIRRRKAAAGA